MMNEDTFTDFIIDEEISAEATVWNLTIAFYEPTELEDRINALKQLIAQLEGDENDDDSAFYNLISEQ